MTERFDLPESHLPFADKYFLRANQIFKAEGINPWVLGQVMIRHGPGTVHGIDEAVAIIDRYSRIREHGGSIKALEDGAIYNPKETIMHILAPIQDIVELETMYLGVISAETTWANDHRNVDLDAVRNNMAAVVAAANGRPIIYMGARHWRYNADALIARAAFDGGAQSTSTDIGAAVIGKEGVGTIPHVLENVLAFYHGRDDAVKMAAVLFDKYIAKDVPRIPLIDYRNMEITDTIESAKALGSSMNAFRQDTCGENVTQGAIMEADYGKLEALTGKQIVIPTEDEKYWFGTGVTVTGTYAIRKALAEAGYPEIKTVLSSGFADPDKVRAFSRAEELLGMQLYHTLGVGQIFHSRAAKMDIVAVGERDGLYNISKTGRAYSPNSRLKLALGRSWPGSE